MLLMAAMLCSGRLAAQAARRRQASGPGASGPGRPAHLPWRHRPGHHPGRRPRRQGPARDRADAQGFRAGRQRRRAPAERRRARQRPDRPRAAVRHQRQHGHRRAVRPRARDRLLPAERPAGPAKTRRRFSRSTRRCTWCSRSRPTSIGCRGRSPNFSPWGMTSLHDAIASASRSMDSRAHEAPRAGGPDRRHRHGEQARRRPRCRASRRASTCRSTCWPSCRRSTTRGTRNGGEPRARTAIWPIWRAGRAGSCSSRRARRKPATSRARLVGELRQQYLIAFEPGTKPGWHPLEVASHGRTAPCRRAADMSRGLAGPSVNSESVFRSIAGGSVNA